MARGGLLARAIILLQVIPGIGWPIKSYAWRVIVAFPDQNNKILMDHFPGKPRETISLDPAQYLFLPENHEDLVVEWRGKVFFKNLGRQNRGFAVWPAAGVNIESAAGGNLRNHFGARGHLEAARHGRHALPPPVAVW